MQDPQVLAKRKAKREVIWKANAKHNLFMDRWLSPSSETYGNAYKSALNAGFSRTYSLNIVNQAPKWISEYLEKLDLTPEHIKQGLQSLAQAAPNSKSPDDTRLKAYEILAKVSGMIDNKQSTTVNIVQPILNGESVKPPQTATQPNKHTDTQEAEIIDLSDE